VTLRLYKIYLFFSFHRKTLLFCLVKKRK